MKMKLTKEEKDLLDSVENGEWKQIDDFKREAARFKQAAKNTMLKSKELILE